MMGFYYVPTNWWIRALFRVVDLIGFITRRKPWE
jgi:hypothetical protein